MTMGYLPVDQIHSHPNNPRRLAVADDEMVDSIRSLGVLTPVTVAPALDGDGYTMIGGHRRKNGAVQADLIQIPAIIREDLVTEAQQLEAMLVENLHRSDLTAVEEAEAYEQLTFAGLDVAAIAAATGRAAATVRSRLKLTTLATSTRDRLHGGEMTLLDAEAMLEFTDDPDATTELEEAIGTGNFRWKVEDLRRRKAMAARNAAQVIEFEELGAKPFDLPAGTSWSRDTVYPLEWFPAGDLSDPAAHDGHLGYHGVDSYAGVKLICTDAASHPLSGSRTTAAAPNMNSEWEKQREERERERVRQEAAAAARMDWLRGHFTGMFTVRSNRSLADAAAAFLPVLIGDDYAEAVDTMSVLRAFGAVPESADYHEARTARVGCAESLATAKPQALLDAFATYLAALVDSVVHDDPEVIDEPDEALRQLAVWDWFKKAGLPFSDVDVEIRNRLEVRATELADGVEDEAS